jgi:ABC-2 type transport system permease protein
VSLLAAELRKLATLPSARLGAAIGLLGAPALAMVSAPAEPARAADAAYVELSAAVVGAILIGVVAVSSEYRDDGAESAAGRGLPTALLATPRRWRLVAAKAGAVAIGAGTTAVLAAAATLPLAGGPYEPGRIAGMVAYWVGMALIAVAITFVTRSGVLPLTLLIADTSVISFSFLLSKVTPAATFLPDLAGQHMFLHGEPTGVRVAPLTGGLVMAGWTAVLLAAAGYVVHRRDAG